MRPAVVFFLLSLTATASAQITVHATGQQLNFDDPELIEQSDGFAAIRTKHSGQPRCVCGKGTAALPDRCEIDFGRTFSTSTGFDGGFGRGGAGYGGVVSSMNTHDGGFAKYTLNTAAKTVTAEVCVCRKTWSTQRGWYEGKHVIYGKCKTWGTWTATYGPYAIPPNAAGTWVQIATIPDPPDDVREVQYTVSAAGTPPLQVGLFAGHPAATAEKGNQLWVKLAATNDLTVTAVEVSQGIQNLANKMPLIADRRTIVRAYVRAQQDNVNGVTAALHAWSGNHYLGSVDAENTAPVRTAGDQRARLDDSFWFLVPPAWRSGTKRFAVEVDSKNVIAETNEANNRAEVTVRFHVASPVVLTGVPFHMHKGKTKTGQLLIYDLRNPAFQRIAANVLRYLPTSQLIVRDCGVPAQTPLFHWFGREWQMDEVGIFTVLTRVGLVRALSSCTDGTAFWVGMIHPEVDTKIGSDVIGGVAVPFGRSSWVLMRDGREWWHPEWYSMGGSTLAHELGHNLGLFHVDCSGSEGFPLGHSYPYPRPDCRLSSGAHSYFGLDVYYDLWGHLTPAVITNDTTGAQAGFPLMGYRDPAWADAFDYCSAMSDFGVPCDYKISYPPNARVPDPGVLQALPGDPVTLRHGHDGYVFVSGVYDVAGDEVHELSVLQLETVSPNAQRILRESFAPPSGLVVEQLDAGGVPLSFQLVPQPVGEGAGNAIPFTAVMPKVRGASGVRVSFEGRTVVDRMASSSLPTVRLIAPTSGSLATGTQIRWAGRDPNFDPLTYTLLYSPDTQRWYPLVVNTTETSYTIPDISRLPGGENARLRILVSDGFHTTSDWSNGLTVPTSPPVPTILQPSLFIPPGRTLALNGTATDIDEGAITSAGAFRWKSDRDGFLGSGQELFKRDLSSGLHRITLEVHDRDGKIGTTSIFVCVCEGGLP